MTQDLRSENWVRDKGISGLLQETVTRDKSLEDYIGFGIYWIWKRDKVWIVEQG